MAELSGENVSQPLSIFYDVFASHWRRSRWASHRYRLLKPLLASAGTGCYISWGCKFVDIHMLSIGSRVSLSNSSIYLCTGGVSIGHNTMIGFGSTLLTITHRSERADIPIVEQGFRQAPITIGEDVWLGCNVVVLPGVTIGDNSIVGAGSVVSRDVASGVIVGGVPAKLIRER